MSKRNKLFDKLVKAAGGWEKFLYQTLKDVCEDLCNGWPEITDTASIEEATEVLEAYEEMVGLTSSTPQQPAQVPKPQVQQVTNEAKPVTNESEPVSIPKNIQAKMAAKPQARPESMSGKVLVDSDAGASQGTLAMPPNFKIVHREMLTISTASGIELGRGTPDGQVKPTTGQGVSGYIKQNGEYRLVFKDAGLGVGIVNYLAILEIPEEEK